MKKDVEEKILDVLGCLGVIIVLFLVLYGLQEIGFFDGLGSETAPLDQPGDGYLRGEAF